MNITIKADIKHESCDWNRYVIQEKHNIGIHETALFCNGKEVFSLKYGFLNKVKNFIEKFKQNL